MAADTPRPPSQGQPYDSAEHLEADHPEHVRGPGGSWANPGGPSRPRSARSKARKRALDILFEAELRSTPASRTLQERTADADPPVRAYTADLVRGVEQYRSEIDRLISAKLAAGWSLARLPRVDRVAIRIAAYEIAHRDDVPDAVAVSEAVELVGELSTDESPAFVNGLLRAIVSGSTVPVQPDLG